MARPPESHSQTDFTTRHANNPSDHSPGQGPALGYTCPHTKTSAPSGALTRTDLGEGAEGKQNSEPERRVGPDHEKERPRPDPEAPHALWSTTLKPPTVRDRRAE